MSKDFRGAKITVTIASCRVYYVRSNGQSWLAGHSGGRNRALMCVIGQTNRVKTKTIDLRYRNETQRPHEIIIRALSAFL